MINAKQLYFSVSISGYLTSFIEMGNLAGLRTFRVLRALKTVAILPSKYNTFHNKNLQSVITIDLDIKL